MYFHVLLVAAVVVASGYSQEAPAPAPVPEPEPAPAPAPAAEAAPAPTTPMAAVPAPAPVPVATLPIASNRNPLCKTRNNYYKVDASCDSYIECRDYTAHEMLCPDGLHFNPDAMWPTYPCSYPTEVSCVGRGAPQPAIPTADCPHQFGFYPSTAATENDCGNYRMCVMGYAIEMMCPPGLAFNPESARCDWPDYVPTCNADAFLGFKCPEVPLGKEGEIRVINYRYEGSCYAFFSCEGSRARLLSCDRGFAFDPASGKCIDADKVACDIPRAPALLI